MKNILVFPCGSEIGLEIHRSLIHNKHFNLIGGSSIKDHGYYVYKNYIPNLPYHDDINFLEVLKNIIIKYNIDAIYPTMDAVADTIKKHETQLKTKVIGSSTQTTNTCSSKKKTYKALQDSSLVPSWREELDGSFPIFIKPDIGYGARNTLHAQTKNEAEAFTQSKTKQGNFIFCEVLPGKEYTIDCFSNKSGELLFCGARERVRISNGISVNTKACNQHHDFFQKCAQEINRHLKFRGAWFFQMKEDTHGNPKLLEVAARLGGSSSLFRVKGVNFALLSIYDYFDIEISLTLNNYEPELDRALNNKYKLSLEYNTVYVDYDDCLKIKDKLNETLVTFLFSALNQGKQLILITKHDGDIYKSLQQDRLPNLFDKIIHVKKYEKKSSFITNFPSIFIDDSFTEREDVSKTHNIPVFSVDMIEALL